MASALRNPSSAWNKSVVEWHVACIHAPPTQVRAHYVAHSRPRSSSPHAAQPAPVLLRHPVRSRVDLGRLPSCQRGASPDDAHRHHLHLAHALHAWPHDRGPSGKAHLKDPLVDQLAPRHAHGAGNPRARPPFAPRTPRRTDTPGLGGILRHRHGLDVHAMVVLLRGA